MLTPEFPHDLPIVVGRSGRVRPREAPVSRPCTALVVIALSACGGSAAHEAADARRQLRSWQSTARLVDAAQAQGAIPPGFAAQVRRADAEARAAAEAKLRKATAP